MEKTPEWQPFSSRYDIVCRFSIADADFCCNRHEKNLGTPLCNQSKQIKANMFKWFEKLINEHGSADIMEKRLALKDEEIKKLQTKISELEAAREQEKLDRDEVLILKGIEFRRGIRTSGKWMPFCPKCHLPAENAFKRTSTGKAQVAICTGRCGWQVFLHTTLEELIKQIDR